MNAILFPLFDLGNYIDMVGIMGPAPVYLNGLAALLFIFALPGVAIIYWFPLPHFPQRWLAVVLSSLTANYFLVTLIAQFHLDPLLTYRALMIATVVALVCMTLRSTMISSRKRGNSVVSSSDWKWLLGSVLVLSFTYWNVWKHGVPNVFQGSDVSVSWNVWALIWAEGKFPQSLGYPQLIPTIWAVTYIFTGSDIQYFAFSTYIILIILPIVLATATLSRVSVWLPAAALLTYVWFVAEIQEPNLRATLQQGFPDWVAAAFAFWGVVLFVAGTPHSRPNDNSAIEINHLLALSMLSIAAAVKPLYGLFALSVLGGTCFDAAIHFSIRERRRAILLAVGLVLAFVAIYVIGYSHLTVRSMPSYPVSDLWARLSGALSLFNRNFSIVFRFFAVTGLFLSPFMPRTRWLTLPLLVGVGLWANSASYDLRNVLGFLMIGAFVPIYVIGRQLREPKTPTWIGSRVSDGAVVLGIILLAACLHSTLAHRDNALRKRFADDQLKAGPGLEFNQEIGKLLAKGCTIFTGDWYMGTISEFRPFREQMQFFHYTQPPTDTFAERLNRSTGCIGFFFVPSDTDRSTMDLIRSKTEANTYRRITDHHGIELLFSDSGS
ncbi:hypothetical protein [Bradyrhizobium sp. S3.9.1]|uniref:hypothetical protein n=1 Tax=Bradyrhizobium sp. S3.9.1 TaxID=3156431 RepID=UPI003392D4AB